MAIRLVEKKFDDLDGKELPDNTRPMRLKFQGREADVYLSAENRKKVESFMDQIFTSAKSRPGAVRRAPKSTHDLSKVRSWLREHGHAVPERGVIKKELIDLYEKGAAAPKEVKKAPAKRAAKKTTKKVAAKKPDKPTQVETDPKADSTPAASSPTFSAPAENVQADEAKSA